jgi:hypothetical protein
MENLLFIAVFQELVIGGSKIFLGRVVICP